jgi:hypothetical protein
MRSVGEIMSKDNGYVAGIFLIIYFATWFTWRLDAKATQVWGANWMGSAEWAHRALFLVTSVCLAGIFLALWRAIYFKKWRRSK